MVSGLASGARIKILIHTAPATEVHVRNLLADARFPAAT
jgi:hypothetical protein